jgi:bacterial/archaeal transporter family protein
MTAFGWALLTAAIWGVVPLMEKVGLGGAPPAAGVVVRSFGVMIGLAAASVIGSPWAAIRGMSWASIALLAGGGLLASFVGQMVFYQALRTGAISQVTPVAGAYPLVAALLGWWILREPFTATRALGVLCVVAGVLLLRR